MMKGKKRQAGYNNQFMLRKGCTPGYTVVMMENASITDNAWEEMTNSIVHGYRLMPVVSGNPQWWMVEVFDGFSTHLHNLVELKTHVINKILSLKEEDDSSSYNQAYDGLFPVWTF